MDISLPDLLPFLLAPCIGWGVRWMKRKQEDYGPVKRATLVVGLAAFLVTEFGRSFYRPFIYAHHVNDIHVADTIGSSTGTVTALFMVLTLTRSKVTKDTHLFLLVFLGLIGYEVLSGAGGHPIDVWDLIATVLFAALSALFYFGYLKPKFNVDVEGKRTA